ncbi:protein-L-isoaspartate O-methyltransferase [Methylocella sp.]|uniref:protein-L-isoaspartate O-methyltransferase n=1 Tax=Methylocella sp. TaxID=1978226 RepID=UPI003783A915
MSTSEAGPAEPPEGAEGRAAFLLEMRARGVQDLRVLRALERVPREAFAPRRYHDLARRHVALPLRCGQTLPEPWLAARMIEALSLTPEHGVLEVGSGSGYAAALMSTIARSVLSVERFQTLAVEASARLRRLGVDNVRIVWGDGLEAGREAGPFDRIIVQGALAEPPESLLGALAADGVLVMARPERGEPLRRRVVRILRTAGGGLDVASICPCRLQPIIPGRSRAL